MQSDEPVDSALKEHFQNHVRSLNTAPDWWRDQKNESFDAFLRLPMPRRKDERWRFSNTSGLDLNTYGFESTLSDTQIKEIIERSKFLDATSGAAVIADNKRIDFAAQSEELRSKGVIWMTLDKAISEHGELLKDYFMKQEIALGSQKFAELHSAFISNGALLYVPKGVEIKDPFIISNWAVSEGIAILPHTLVIAEEFSSVKIVDTHFSFDRESRALSCGVTHLFAGVGAKIDYTLLQDYNEKVTGFQINSNIAGQNSLVKTVSVNVGCSRYRSETHGQIKGAGAHVEMLSLAVANADQEIDQRTLQSHSAPHATSDLLFKNALKDKAKTIFSGLIKVDEGAQQTDAYQTNRNLLLSNAAEANSLPGLEIQANDVKCSHGATTSQIEDEELFYMRARGIPLQKAQELIVYGFFEEVLERIDNDQLADLARQIIQTKFSD